MYNAFISYSHEADNKFAPALQYALQMFAKPWYKKRHLEIFRDESNLSVSPELWTNITKALDQSEYLVLLASPASEKSKWVNKEIEYWIKHKSVGTILIVLTEGIMEWDDMNNCFLNPANNALPPAMDSIFKTEPFYIDLRKAKSEDDLSLDNPIFKNQILSLAAELHNMQPNDLASEEVKEHRRIIRIRNGVFGSLVFLLFLAMFAGWKANEKRKEAEIETRKAQSLTLAAIASEQFERNQIISIRLAELAWQKSPTYPPNFSIQRAIARGFYDGYSLHSINFLSHNGRVFNATFSPDGNVIVTASSDNTAKIWNAKSKEIIADINGHKGFVNNAAFSPKGNSIVTASADSTAKIWNSFTGKMIVDLIGHNGQVINAIFSQMGKAL